MVSIFTIYSLGGWVCGVSICAENVVVVEFSTRRLEAANVKDKSMFLDIVSRVFIFIPCYACRFPNIIPLKFCLGVNCLIFLADIRCW